jgi:adenosylmethionine---8-amino-7-oxononanoate aminotransferase
LTVGASHPTDLHALDLRHVWHPFTPFDEWASGETLVIDRANGPWLYDADGRRYLDGVSSLWCNIHGHRHPTIDARIKAQLDKVAHTTFLGASHAPGIELATRLAELAPKGLTRVFFSDDGSTAAEAGLKLAIQYMQQTGQGHRTRIAALTHAYHGDTLGTVATSGIELFHHVYKPLVFEVSRLVAPSAEELPGFDPQAPMDRLKAVHALAPLIEAIEHEGPRLAAVICEPLVQMAAGVRTLPRGLLALLRRLCDDAGCLLIVDEVATGFGRTGTMFACEREQVAPDVMLIAKGLTGGYLPLAATLTTERLFEAFRGPVTDHRTFFHGHSYTANPLACAAALGSLDVFRDERTLDRVQTLVRPFEAGVARLRASPFVRAARSLGPDVGKVAGSGGPGGLVAGFDLVRPDGSPFPEGLRAAYNVALVARLHGVLVRPISDTLIVMPPLSIRADELAFLFDGVEAALKEMVPILVSRSEGQGPTPRSHVPTAHSF